MDPNTLNWILAATPLVVGGVIAAVNLDASNAVTERVEAWARARYERTSERPGWFLRYVVNPLLWMIVTFCAWTDGFTHRGIKNGTRVAAALYLVTAWLFFLYIAVMVIIAIALVVAAIWVVLKVLAGASTPSDSEDDRLSGYEAVRGSKSYVKTGMFSETESGHTDEDGRVFRKTGMFTDEEIGRIAEDGTTFKKTGMFSEEETGRTGEDGRVYRKTGMFSEEEVGRIDPDGRLFKKTGMFSEEETGRVERA